LEGGTVDMEIDYRKLAEKYLSVAKQVAGELRENKGVIGCAIIGSTARGVVHSMSDIDLLVLVDGSGIYRWERRIVKNIVVNLAFRSWDILEKMAREHPDTILALKDTLILYDPQGVLQSLKKDVSITKSVKEELLGDLLDEARSFIGKAERALAQSGLESSILCLRQGAIKLVEYMFFKETGNRINRMYFWQEIKDIPFPCGFKNLFAEIQGFKDVEKLWLIKMLKKVKSFLLELKT